MDGERQRKRSAAEVEAIMQAWRRLEDLLGDDAGLVSGPEVKVPEEPGSWTPTHPDEDGMRLFLADPVAYYATVWA